jgi:pimeloyl-ACP methyl ester carboxylesterase
MDLGDVTIHYEEAGLDNPAAYVFCHGLGGSGALFTEQFDFWSRYFHVVAWDNRGLGRSSAAAKYNLPLYASDLDRLMGRLGIDRALVHGVSWGGVLVQQFALDYPQRCAAIILDSTSSEVNVAASENWYRRGEVARLGAAAAVGEFVPAFAGHTASARSIQEAGTRPRPEHVESYVAQARAIAGLREHPFTPRLKEIRCPALVVGGGQDGTAGAAGSVIIARNLPDARLHLFQDAGHGIFRQKPEEFRRLVLDFAREIGLLPPGPA